MSPPLLTWRSVIAGIVPFTIMAALAGRWGAGPQCEAGPSGLIVPDDFCATLVAGGLGEVRQMAVAPNGDLYAAGRSRIAGLRGGVVVLHDRDSDGRADQRARFGPGGGNDVDIHEGYVYLALDDRILRWPLVPGTLVPEGQPETVVADLPDGGNHTAKSIAFGPGNSMYVNIGSASNSCQRADRVPRSPGVDPCRELERRAGIWRFEAGRAGQRMADGRRYATGLRNAEAIGVQPGTGALFAAVNGRDQLGANWGFTDQQNAENPAEELLRVQEGDDFGWPYCYYSNDHHRKVLAPEYGGDGEQVGRCSSAKDPLIAFPAHWAPLALEFYPGGQFGSEYQGGLFIAFHGSWNRAPLPQAGFRVVFVPFEEGVPTGAYETFATGAGGPTELRASGLAVGSDGALYVSADENGKIWKVTRR